MIKLKNLIKEQNEDMSMNEIAFPFFNKFHEVHGYNIRFQYIGKKGDEYIYKAPLTNLGQMELIVSEAYVLARVTEKKALFGVVYLLNGMEELDATICRMTNKKGVIEAEMFDDKEFENNETKFLDIIEKVK